jgi:hypothetical protein
MSSHNEMSLVRCHYSLIPPLALEQPLYDATKFQSIVHLNFFDEKQITILSCLIMDDILQPFIHGDDMTAVANDLSRYYRTARHREQSGHRYVKDA